MPKNQKKTIYQIFFLLKRKHNLSNINDENIFFKT